MKRLIYVMLTIFFLGLGVSVQAKTCNVNFFTYFAADYINVPYCDGNNFSTCGTLSDGTSPKNLCSSGCYALTVASILKSYGEDVNPIDVAEYLCQNHYDDANSVNYGTISVTQAFHDEFNMEMKFIGHTFKAIDNTLKDGAMVLASVTRNGNKYPKGEGFTDGSHYIAIAAKQGDKYFVINTSASDSSSYKYSGWYDRNHIEKYVVDAANAKWWSVKPKTCDNVNINFTDSTFTENGGPSSSGILGGLMDDHHENIFPNINGQKCANGNEANIFVDCNGEYTPLKDFFDDLFLLIKIAAPVLVIVLSTIDYVKAIASSNADDLKKTNKRTIMRLIIGLLIFILPFLLELLFQLFGLYDLNTSGIGK